MELLTRRPSKKLQESIIKAAKEFWDLKEAPAPSARGYDFANLKALYNNPDGEIVDGKELDSKARRLVRLNALAKAVKLKVDGVKTELLNKLGNGSLLQGDGWKFTAIAVDEKEIAYTRKPYVMHRFTSSKRKR